VRISVFLLNLEVPFLKYLMNYHITALSPLPTVYSCASGDAVNHLWQLHGFKK